MRARRVLGASFVALTLLAGAAAAQPSAQDAAAAQALFEAGKRLMKEKKFAEACAKLAESNRLEPAAGTFLALALCHEEEGKTASAWAEFNQVLTEARRDKRADRENAAQEHIRALEPRLVRVSVVVDKEPAGLEVRRDGTSLGKAQWGVALPIDPGMHAFDARAPGKKAWSASIDVSGEGKTVEVKVPPLEDEAATPPVPTATTTATAPPAASTAPAPSTPAPPPASDPGSGQRMVGWIVGGAGVVALGVGSFFGLRAFGKWSDAEKRCPNHVCTNEADRKLGDDAKSAADLSSVLVGVGLAAVATGVVLLLTAPSGGERTATAPRVRVAPAVGTDAAGFTLRGTF